MVKSPRLRKQKSERVRLRVTRFAKKHRTSPEERDLALAMRESAGQMLPTGLRPRIAVEDLANSRGRGRGRNVAAKYDAAQTVDGNRRHWANADSLSASAANSPAVRLVLRNRARYEVANNSYAKGLVLTLANDVVGPGPLLDLLTDDAALNAKVERAWSAWAKRIRLAAKLRTMRMARATDGEAFGLLTTNEALRGNVKLDLKLIEADLVASPSVSVVQSSIIDGIEYDKDGNPTSYHVLRAHPGDTNRATLMWQSDPVAANLVIHWFRADRPGQLRGVPDITAALPLFAQLRRYTLAVISAAETAADFAAVLYTESPPGNEGTDDMSPFDSYEIENSALTFMPCGWKLAQLKAEQPITGYAEFKREIISEIARCCNVPLIVALLQAKDYNMASGRLDLQTYFKHLDVERAEVEEVILDTLFDAWLEEASRSEKLGKIDSPEHRWLWTKREHVDPAKAAAAASSRRSSWTSSLAAEYAAAGESWEAELRQIVREAKMLSKELGVPLLEALEILGLKPKPASGRPAGTPNAADAPDDEEKD